MNVTKLKKKMGPHPGGGGVEKKKKERKNPLLDNI